MVRLVAGHSADALRYVQEAEETFGRLSAPPSSPWLPQVLDTYGQVLLALDRVDEARDRFLAGLKLIAENGNDSNALSLLQGLACLSARTGESARCLELLAAARSCAVRGGRNPRWAAAAECDKAERESRRLLGTEVAEAAWERGFSMDLAAVLARFRVGRSPAPPLTRRQMEIVSLVTQGLGNKEIGRRLSISERTVEAHLEQVRNRLCFHSRTQIAAWAATNIFDEASPDPAVRGTR